MAGGERQWGLGFRVYGLREPGNERARYSAVGHSGLGGSVAFADLHTKTAVAITVNALTLDKYAVNELVRTVCDELGMGRPVDFD